MPAVPAVPAARKNKLRRIVPMLVADDLPVIHAKAPEAHTAVSNAADAKPTEAHSAVNNAADAKPSEAHPAVGNAAHGSAMDAKPPEAHPAISEAPDGADRVTDGAADIGTALDYPGSGASWQEQLVSPQGTVRYLVVPDPFTLPVPACAAADPDVGEDPAALGSAPALVPNEAIREAAHERSLDDGDDQPAMGSEALRSLPYTRVHMLRPALESYGDATDGPSMRVLDLPDPHFERQSADAQHSWAAADPRVAKAIGGLSIVPAAPPAWDALDPDDPGSAIDSAAYQPSASAATELAAAVSSMHSAHSTLPGGAPEPSQAGAELTPTYMSQLGSDGSTFGSVSRSLVTPQHLSFTPGTGLGSDLASMWGSTALPSLPNPSPYSAAQLPLSASWQPQHAFTSSLPLDPASHPHDPSAQSGTALEYMPGQHAPAPGQPHDAQHAQQVHASAAQHAPASMHALSATDDVAVQHLGALQANALPAAPLVDPAPIEYAPHAGTAVGAVPAPYSAAGASGPSFGPAAAFASATYSGQSGQLPPQHAQHAQHALQPPPLAPQSLFLPSAPNASMLPMQYQPPGGTFTVATAPGMYPEPHSGAVPPLLHCPGAAIAGQPQHVWQDQHAQQLCASTGQASSGGGASLPVPLGTRPKRKGPLFKRGGLAACKFLKCH